MSSPNGWGGASNHVLALTKSGQPWAGYNVIVDTEGILRIGNSSYPSVAFNYYSPKADSPVAVQLFIGETMSLQMIKTASVGWNNIKFDFSTAPGWSASNIYSNIVFSQIFRCQPQHLRLSTTLTILLSMVR